MNLLKIISCVSIIVKLTISSFVAGPSNTPLNVGIPDYIFRFSGPLTKSCIALYRKFITNNFTEIQPES